MNIRAISVGVAGAAALLLTSVSAQAATVLSFGAASAPGNVGWLNAGSGGTFSTGTYTAPSSDTIQVQLINLFVGDTADVASTFTLDGVAPSGNAASAFGAHIFQDGIGGGSPGSFSIIAATAFVYHSHLYLAGTNVLSGTFDSGEIAGEKGGSLGSLSSVTAADVTFTSAIGLPISSISADNNFVLDLASIKPSLSASAGMALNSFNATAAGQFVSAVVPEPATWGLMFMGFGAMGAMIRSSRRKQRLAVTA